MREATAVSDLMPSTDLGRHVIASIAGTQTGPTLIVIGGIHGNEPAGIIAAQHVAPKLEKYRASLKGQIILLSGNTRAVTRGVRYMDADLNRLWTKENIARLRSDERLAQARSEEKEVGELLELFDLALKSLTGELYFLDLHTTSAHGVPFATVGDTLRNRKFAMNFPTTIVLGLEEQIEGTMLEYLNNLGAVTMGFEAGQHAAVSSVEHAESVIWIALVAAGILRRETTPECERAFSLLESTNNDAGIVEVRHRHAISRTDSFKMNLGFENFQAVSRGQILARDASGPIKAIESGMVLMPLYQNLGDDGFFLGRTIKPFWLRLSALLRKLGIGDFIHLLPGVRRQTPDGSSFIVNTRVARVLPLQVFHLLGFRKRRWRGNELVVSRRRYDLAGPARVGT